MEEKKSVEKAEMGKRKGNNSAGAHGRVHIYGI